MERTLKLSETETLVLTMALEFYIRLGLGQFSEIATRLDLLQGGRLKPEVLERVRQLCDELEELTWGEGNPWTLDGDDTSIYTLTAFAIEAKIARSAKASRWVARRIKERAAQEPLDPRE